MIHFACLQCGMKFKVKDEFAGKSSKCLACKHPVQVPAASQTSAHVPSESIDGSESSLDKAEINPSVTLGSHSERVSTSLDKLAQKKVGRYVIDREIARGGMGAVLRGIDRDIRREVAIKFMLDDSDPKKKSRFVEEAQITGQLEHPNIVPVHELGIDSQKRLFFTMKMVKGRSLEQILKLQDDSEDTPPGEPYTLGRLLTLFVNICHAMEFAHSRKVIHRDLKPANIMVGDFGEVYVMDWGLAKVLSESERSAKGAAFPMALAHATGGLKVATSAVALGQSTVTTSRGGEADLTQEGAIMGTPAYMPPEQALGNLQEVNERSDIYSLGAILYAVLTGLAPVEKGGDAIALLMRVIDGAIKRPEERTPDRAVPPELSAIAMKALAKDAKDRYPTVASLRRDVELFLEGRSVSAKRDSAWEMMRKFVKRNKGLSAGLALALLVLLGSLVVVFSAWRETSTAYARFEKEQREKEQRTRESVPAFLKAARLAVERKDLTDALTQATVASDYDAGNADALLLRGQILLANRQYTAATTELDRYLKLRPEDAPAQKLAKLCAASDADDPNVQEAIGLVLLSQRQPNLAAGFFQATTKQLEAYRQHIKNGGWPGSSSTWNLEFDKDHKLSYSINGSNVVDKYLDLAPFRGIPIARMRLTMVRIPNLDALHGMPLESLTLQGLPVLSDLSGLRGTALSNLEIDGCPLVADLSPLQNLKLTSLRVRFTPRIKDLSPLKGMPLQRLILHGHNSTIEVDDLTAIRDLPLEDLVLDKTKVKRFDTLPELKRLRSLAIRHHSTIENVKFLKGMALEELDLYYLTSLRDVSPLQGMPLKRLSMSSLSGEFKDLTPLRGMPLIDLDLGSLKGADLTPLDGMRLESIRFNQSVIKSTKGLDVLRSMPSLRAIQIGNMRVEPAEFWEKFDAGKIE